jgi:hypothetical protein
MTKATAVTEFKLPPSCNDRISGDSFPFWGNGSKEGFPKLCRKKTHCSPETYTKFRISEKRIAEARCSAQPAWKLFGAGSVGSQVLLGLPYLKRLRDDPELSPVSCVWPFETGLKLPDRSLQQGPLIVHAEIYPSIVKVTVGTGEVKDAVQVEAMARHFAARGEEGTLATLFAGPPDLTTEQTAVVENEEGWILGVM